MLTEVVAVFAAYQKVPSSYDETGTSSKQKKTGGERESQHITAIDLYIRTRILADMASTCSK